MPRSLAAIQAEILRLRQRARRAEEAGHTGEVDEIERELDDVWIEWRHVKTMSEDLS